jgi:cell division protein ZapA (FtsZ GTPase activity inhibitor)
MSQEVVKEGKEGSYMAKQQLFIIATLAYEMWQNMEEGTQLEDWMESKIAQSEQSITAVVKSFMYGEIEDEMKGMSQLNFDEMVIGK